MDQEIPLNASDDDLFDVVQQAPVVLGCTQLFIFPRALSLHPPITPALSGLCLPAATGEDPVFGAPLRLTQDPGALLQQSPFQTNLS